MKTPLASAILSLCLIAFTLHGPQLAAQSELESLQDPEPVITTAQDGEKADIRIRERIVSIFQVIDDLKDVEVSVSEGVVDLAGNVANEAEAEQALKLAIRIEGVVTVRDRINRTLALEDNIRPVLEKLTSAGRAFLNALPLIGVSILMAVTLALLGAFVARRQRLISAIAPNAFLAELLSQAIRITSIFAGFILALNLLGAGGMVATIVGGAGVLGLAIGFAVRDSMDNYISSIMLSLRQPFRAKDHVVINAHEGIVVRLTSRATILMTLDGNHLRIPNSEVFKGTILNYSTNPERRFDFELGIDAEDDPIAGMRAGSEAVSALPFVLAEPEASAVISQVGDSNIVLLFFGWIDQRETNFGKARSMAIRAAMRALEAGGFTMPEPIYRLRFDGTSPIDNAVTVSEERVSDGNNREPTKRPMAEADESLDVRPDNHLAEIVEEELREQQANDLLDNRTPRE